jgi:general stress protein YciG
MAERPPEVIAYLKEIGKKGGKGSLKTMTKEERANRAREAGKASGVTRRKKAAKKSAAKKK